MLRIESIKSFCIGIGDIETRQRPNRADSIRYHGTFRADHTPVIQFSIDDFGERVRLSFPTEAARQAADYYGVRQYIKDTIKEALS